MSQYTEITTMAATASASSARPPETTSSTNYLISSVRDNLINASERQQQQQQDDVNNFVFHFSWLDYAFFVGLLSLSALIGIYYGFFSKHKQNNTAEYILGGRSMKILPVATSMIATLVLQITLLVSVLWCFFSVDFVPDLFLSILGVRYFFSLCSQFPSDEQTAVINQIIHRFFSCSFVHSLPYLLSFPVIAIYQVKL